MTSLADVPILGNIELGATYATDFNENAGVLDGAI